MPIDIVGNKCCGCRACVTSCKFDAISIITDKYGFEYPEIDNTKCVGCGACDKVCPMLNDVITGKRHSCGAAYALNDETKEQGSSGGLFGVLAESIIKDDGVVYGAAFDADMKLKTTSAHTKEELLPLYKSKYLLCDTNDEFLNIKSELNNGKKVLYCSSPCQVAALKLFLKKEYDNLITVDFVCHGVGSQAMFDRSVDYIEKKTSARINNFVFRHKGKKASSHYYRYECDKNGKKSNRSNLYMFFPYYYAYQLCIAYRDECYKCKFAKEDRVSDITIGDFHTIEKYNKSIDRFAGVSMYVCNTDKGQTLFDTVKDHMYTEDFDWEILRKSNRFGGTENPPSQRQDFLNAVAERPFGYVVKQYLNPYWDWRLIYYKTPGFIRNFARKILGK